MNGLPWDRSAFLLRGHIQGRLTKYILIWGSRRVDPKGMQMFVGSDNFRLGRKEQRKNTEKRTEEEKI